MYRLALVEYLNTFPFSEGIKLTGLDQQAEIHRVIPALCAQLFQERKVDISLCPVGALNDMPDHEIRGRYCIGADGKVDTVVLLSRVPMEEITRVRFDDHSRTSNLLLQVLAKMHWKKSWKFYFNGHDAEAATCLMIGDKVFQYKSQYPYSYDLAEEWKAMTGLPMVFALWIAKPDTEESFIRQIDEAFEKGMDTVRNGTADLEDWQRDYLLRSISYTLDDQKMEALELFRQYISEL
jgi:chorismate dehydratase